MSRSQSSKRGGFNRSIAVGHNRLFDKLYIYCIRLESDARIPGEEGLEVLQGRVDGLLEIAGLQEASAGDLKRLETSIWFEAQLAEPIFPFRHSVQIRKMVDQRLRKSV